MNIYKALKEYKQFIIAAIFFSILGTGVTFALPYVPTDQELDPTCAPGDTDCYVSIFPDQTSNTGKLLFTDGTNPAWASNLYWDETNDRLGVGTVGPDRRIDILDATNPQLRLTHTDGSFYTDFQTDSNGHLFIMPLGRKAGINISNANLLGFSSGTAVFTVQGTSNQGVLQLGPSSTLLDGELTGSVVYYNNTSSIARIVAEAEGASANSGHILFQTRNAGTETEKARITHAGNFGIGTNAPAYQLHIAGTSPNLVLDRFSNDAIPAVFRSRKARGTQATPTGVLTDDGLIYIQGNGYHGSDYQDAGRLAFFAAENWTNISTASYFTVNTTPIGSTTGFERMRINHNGNVGIGTTNPNTILELRSTTSGQGRIGIFESSTGGGGIIAGTTNALPATNDRLAFFAASNSTSNGALMTFHAENTWVAGTSYPTYMTIHLVPSGSDSLAEVFRISSAGNVGIGTTAPVSRLHVGVAPTASANYGLVSLGNGAFDGTTSGFFTGSASGTTLAINNASGYAGDLLNIQIAGVTKFKIGNDGSTSINSSSALPIVYGGGAFTFEAKTSGQPGNIIAMGNNGAGTNPVARFIFAHHYGSTYTPVAQITSDRDSADDAGNLRFYTRATGGALTDQMNISSSGNVSIGDVGTSSHKLRVGSAAVLGVVARFVNSTGTCDINPTNTALICSSDLTLKKNINSIDSSLSLLTQLRPVTYNWNTQDDTTTPTPGFIAQEVETIFPFLVTTDTNTNLKSLNYTLFTPYIIKSIQELNENLTSLDPTKPNTLASLIKEYLGDALNGLEQIFVRKAIVEEICLQDGTCLNEGDIRNILEMSRNYQGFGSSSPASAPEEESSIVEDEGEIAPEPEPETVEEEIIEETPVVGEEIIEEPAAE